MAGAEEAKLQMRSLKSRSCWRKLSTAVAFVSGSGQRALPAMARHVSYFYAPAAPRAAPAVVTMPVRQLIYVSPCAAVPPTRVNCPGFGCNFPAKVANVPLVRPVSAATRPFIPCLPRKEHVSTVVQTTTKTVVSAPRPSAPTGLVGPNLEVPLNKGVEKLSPQEVHQLLVSGQGHKCVVVDVRSADRASGHIQGSVHEPTSFQAPLLNRVPELVAKFSKEKLVAGSSGSVLVARDCAT
eukprot:s1772_g14.t1